MRITIVVLAIVGSFLLGFAAMYGLADSYGMILYPDRLDLSSFDWTGVSAIAALLTFAINVLLVLTVVVGFRSVQEGQAARSAQVLAWATNQMDAVKGDERHLRTSPLCLQDWDDETREAARRVSNAYQRMCYYVRNQLIDTKHFRSNWGVNISIYWLLLEPYVKSEREKFGDRSTAKEGAYLRADFETVALQFIKHFGKSNPGMIKTYQARRAEQVNLLKPQESPANEVANDG